MTLEMLDFSKHPTKILLTILEVMDQVLKHEEFFVMWWAGYLL